MKCKLQIAMNKKSTFLIIYFHNELSKKLISNSLSTDEGTFFKKSAIDTA